jgi:hypothetical protein
VSGRILIRIKLEGRIRIRIRISIKVKSRIRVRINVMPIRNNAQHAGVDPTAVLTPYIKSAGGNCLPDC